MKPSLFSRFFVVLFTLAFTLSLTGPVRAGGACSVVTDPLGCVLLGASDPVHIAYLLTLSGDNSGLGLEEQRGAELAIDDLGGAILGHTIQFDGQDGECSQTGGATAAQLLDDDPSILAVVGTTCSVEAIGAMQHLSLAGFSVVSPSNTLPALTESSDPDFDLYLRVSWNDRLQAETAAQYAYDELGLTTAATIANNAHPYSEALAQAFASKFIALGGSITSQQTIDPTNTADIDAKLLLIEADPPAVLYMPVFMPEGGYIIDHLPAGLAGVQLMATDGLLNPGVNAAANEEGLLLTSYDFTATHNADFVTRFLPAYRAKYGADPSNPFHAHAYDTFMLIAAAIESAAVDVGSGAHEIGRQALRDALYATTNYNGLTGNLTCDANGDCAHQAMAIYQFHADQFPPEYLAPDKVGLVMSESGLDDLSFNYAAYQGLLQAETDFGIAKTLYWPSSSDDYESSLQQCVNEGNGLCIAVGFGMFNAINNVANANSNTKFSILDTTSNTLPSNLRGIVFNAKQVGYLAGTLAGKMTGSNIIGAVGGMKIPPVIAFISGYRNGAQCADPNVKVLTRYTGSFGDETLGANTAEFMMSQGADVIFGAAGSTGNGAILHSAQADVWSIGVDSDQYVTLFGNGAVDGSDKLLSSAMKRLDKAVYDTIDDYLNDSFTSGTVEYGLAENGVGLAPYHETDGSIPTEIKNYVNAVKADILADNIDIDDPCHDPTILASPDENSVWGENWFPNDDVMIYVDDNANIGDGFIYSGSTTSDADGVPAFVWDTGFHYELTRGEYVTVTDDDGGSVHTHTKTVQIKNLRFDYANQAGDDIASGRGPSGDLVNVYIQTDSGQAQINDVAIASGAWQADFSGALDLENLQETSATSYDGDGDGTLTRLPPPTKFTVQPDHGWVQGWNWPAEIEVTVTIDNEDTFTDPVLYSANQTPGDDLSFWVQVEPDIDLIPGYYVQVSNGTITRTTQIEEVHLDSVDFTNDVVTGRGPADAFAGVYVQTDVGQHHIDNVSIDSSGNWMADFSAESIPFDIQNLQDVNVEVYDSDGDGSMAHLPNFTVQPDHGWVNANGWVNGSHVTVTVDDDNNPADPLYSGSVTIASGDYSSAHFAIEPTIDLLPGQYVWVSAGDPATSPQVKFLEIQEVHFNALNSATGLAEGTGPDQPASAYVHDDTGNHNMNATVASGNWSADFAMAFTNVTDANVRFSDEDGDGTMAHLNYPPTVALVNKLTSLPENASTASARKMADIEVTDNDGTGVNVLSLSGADASLFQIVGSALYLKAGAVLDYETNPVLDVTVNVDDAHVGVTPDDSEALSVAITNVIDYEVVQNGGFNTYIGTSKVPANWVKNSAFSKTTDGKYTKTKKEGTASVRIVGNGKTKTLTQSLAFSGSAGEALYFSYWVKASSLSKTGTCRAQVLFYSGTVLKGTKTVNCPSGTTYNWKNAKLSLTAPAAYNKVVVKITFSKATGTAWFDWVSLKK